MKPWWTQQGGATRTQQVTPVCVSIGAWSVRGCTARLLPVPRCARVLTRAVLRAGRAATLGSTLKAMEPLSTAQVRGARESGTSVRDCHTADALVVPPRSS